MRVENGSRILGVEFENGSQILGVKFVESNLRVKFVESNLRVKFASQICESNLSSQICESNSSFHEVTAADQHAAVDFEAKSLFNSRAAGFYRESWVQDSKKGVRMNIVKCEFEQYNKNVNN